MKTILSQLLIGNAKFVLNLITFKIIVPNSIKGFNTSRMAVFAGTNDLREEDKGQRIMIDSCEIHPDYVELNTSDIAVCRLKESFSMGDNITPIEMGTEHIEGGEECLL